MANCKKIISILFVLITCKVLSFGQENILLNPFNSYIPNGRISQENQNKQLHLRSFANGLKANDSNNVFYRFSRQEEYYNHGGVNGVLELSYILNYDYNEFGILIKNWYENENHYSLYFYDSQNRNNRIEHYRDNYDGELDMEAYHEIDYLKDFPELESSIIYYTKDYNYDWDNKKWNFSWEIYSGSKRDYTKSKKIPNYYEKKVDYTYNTNTKQWDVSGYKYDYVINSKGLIVETLVYKATAEEESKWPLILHVKNLINDNGVVFRSERFNYQTSTPYIERWSNIQWDKHNGAISISDYDIKGDNRMKSAKIEYILESNPNIEYAPSQNFTCEYQNEDSYHYIITDDSGNKIIDNSYYRTTGSSIQELWQGNFYQMQYKDIDEIHNWVVHSHIIEQMFYENGNVITLKNKHTYNNNEYYRDTNYLTLAEYSEYDELTDSEPFVVFRSIYSGYKEFNSEVNNIMVDDPNIEPVYYSLQGQILRNPSSGQIVIKKEGSKSAKIIFR